MKTLRRQWNRWARRVAEVANRSSYKVVFAACVAALLFCLFVLLGSIQSLLFARVAASLKSLLLLVAGVVACSAAAVGAFKFMPRRYADDEHASTRRSWNVARFLLVTSTGLLGLISIVLALANTFQLEIAAVLLAKEHQPLVEERCLALESGNILPKGFCAIQGQLETLVAPSEIKNIGWVADSVRDLDLSRTEVADLHEIGPEVEVLTIDKLTIGSLSLPDSIVELNAKGATIGIIRRLPLHLASLDLEEATLGNKSALQLPKTIETLSIDAEDYLTALEVSGSLPRLESLLLRISRPLSEAEQATVFRAPLRKLTIKAIGYEEIAFLPSSLRELEVHGVTLHSLPRHLQVFNATDTVLTARFKDLSTDLSDLTLVRPTQSGFDFFKETTSSNPTEGEAVRLGIKKVTYFKRPFADMRSSLPNLQHYAVHWAKPVDVQSVPRMLKVLEAKNSDLAGLEPVETPHLLEFLMDNVLLGDLGSVLPSSVRRVGFRNCGNLEDLSSFRGRLEVLDLSGCGITQLPRLSSETMSSLRDLDVSYTDISSLDGLPPSIEKLNIAGTDIRSLQDLPPGLRSLGIHDKQIEDLSEADLSSLVSVEFQSRSTRRGSNLDTVGRFEEGEAPVLVSADAKETPAKGRDANE